jgi:cell division protein ZapA (FtsZ GTPase activity inhibitor)
MAALNITHELIQSQQHNKRLSEELMHQFSHGRDQGDSLDTD